MAKGNKETRTRGWTIVLYPDSAPENWRDILDSYYIEWVESPLHDSDLNADGEKKKPHWHILLLFSGVKDIAQIVELVAPLNCPIPQKVHNQKSLVRYMAHLDNPEKSQYDISDIKAHGGVDIQELLKPSSSERKTLIKEMSYFIKDNNIIEFQDLFDYAAEHREDDWFPLIVDNSAYILDKYISSQRNRIKCLKKIDYGTGEIIKDNDNSEAAYTPE